MSWRVVLADDHRMVGEALRALLAREPDIRVLDVVNDGLAAVARVGALRPDVLVTDLSMPGLSGFEAIGRAKAACAGLRVLCLSLHRDERSLARAFGAGADGYVAKEACFDELALAIRTVGSRRRYLGRGLGSDGVEAALRSPGRRVAADVDGARLTRRERQVVQLLSEGLTTQQVAERLFISGKTVATHRENVMRKLELGGLAELVRYALREGISSLDASCAELGSRPAVARAQSPQSTDTRMGVASIS